MRLIARSAQYHFNIFEQDLPERLADLQQKIDTAFLVAYKILEHDSYGYGFDAQTGEFGNLVSKGIITDHG